MEEEGEGEGGEMDEDEVGGIEAAVVAAGGRGGAGSEIGMKFSFDKQQV